ncbi:MAG: outer membrane protein assembly factor BamB [Magnetococcales bacterium]|nr:outer membrane protein assembly factor BamB [Magnetococcales bacterium]
MTAGVRIPAALLALTLLLTGCSSAGPWFGGKEKPEDEKVQDYVEPKPGQPVGLKQLWRTGVAGSPDEYFFHPRTIGLTGEAVYMATRDGQVTALSRPEGDTLWETDLDAPVAGGVAVDETRVYVGTLDGDMVALHRADGKPAWRVPVSSSVASAPQVAAGKVIFLTLDNRTYALDAASGERLWVHTTPPESLVVMGAATPTVSGRMVLVGYSSGEVFALALDSGQRIWSTNLTVLGKRSELDLLQDVDAPVVAGEGRFYAVNHQGRLVALQPSKGTFLWERSLSAVRRPLLADNRLYVSDVDGSLTALGTEDGIPLWTTRLSDGLLTAPVMYRGRIVVGDSKGRLFAVDPTSGRVLGLDHLGDDLFSDPVVDGNNLFLWTNDGNTYRFE